MKLHLFSPAAQGIVAILGLLVWSSGFHPVLADENVPMATAAPSPEPSAASDTALDFARDVLPILRINCLACHNEKTAEAGLSLETVEAMLQGGDSGPAIDRDHPGMSSIVVRARSEDEIMPPEDNAVGAQPLTAEQIDLLQRWIAAGAPDTGAPQSNDELWQPLPPRLQPIYAVRFSLAGDRLAVGRGNSIMMHEVPSGQLLQTLADPALAPTDHQPNPGTAASDGVPSPAAHRDYVNVLAFHPDGELLASGDFRALKLWRLATDPVEVETEALRKQIATAVLAPATSPAIDEATQTRVAAWDLGGSELRQIVLSPDDRHAVTVVPGGPAKLWNWADGKWIADLGGDPVWARRVNRQEHAVARQQAHAAFVEAQIPEAEKLSGSEEEARQKVEQTHQKLVEDLQAKQTKLAEAEAALRALDKTSEDAQAETAPPAAEAEQRAALEKQRDEAKTAIVAAEAMIAAAAQALAAAEDTRDQAATAVARMKESAEQQRAHASKLEEQLEEMRQTAAMAAGEEPLVAAFSPGGEQVAVAFAGGTVGLFASSDGRQLMRLRHGLESPGQLRFVDGGWLVAVPPTPSAADEASIGTTSSDADPMAPLAVWNIGTPWQLDRVIGDPLGESPFTDRIVALDFSPDGSWLVVGSGDPSRFGEVHLVSVSEGEVVTSWGDLHSDVVLGVRVSPDGRQLATCGADRQVRLVDFPSGENMQSLEGHTHHVLSIDWQDDGRRLISGSADRTIKVWSVQTRAVERTIAAGSKEVTSLAFVGTTSQFVAASGEGKVILYDANDGGQKQAYSAVTSFQHAVATGGTGETLAAGGEDGTLRFWKTTAPEPIQ